MVFCQTAGQMSCPRSLRRTRPWPPGCTPRPCSMPWLQSSLASGEAQQVLLLKTAKGDKYTRRQMQPPKTKSSISKSSLAATDLSVQTSFTMNSCVCTMLKHASVISHEAQQMHFSASNTSKASCRGNRPSSQLKMQTGSQATLIHAAQKP